MVEIGGKPILWHIMKIYSAHGVKDFIIYCGYKGYVIKEYQELFLHQSNLTFQLQTNEMEVHHNKAEPWKITLVDTDETHGRGRLKHVKEYVKNENHFFFTYGDGVGNIDITSLLKFHNHHGKQATLTAVRPPGRYEFLKLGSDDVVNSFREKPEGDGNWINGGFFVLSPDVIENIKDDQTSWEKGHYLVSHQKNSYMHINIKIFGNQWIL